MQSPYNNTLGSIGMDHFISEPCHKGTILKRNYRKTTIQWSFSYNFFEKFHGKRNLEATTFKSVLYPNPYYNEVCYKVTVLYLNEHHSKFFS